LWCGDLSQAPTEALVRPRCGWHGRLATFSAVSSATWLTDLQRHHHLCMGGEADLSQITAWEESFHLLKQACSTLLSALPAAAEWTLIFEYELPRERGRRPDVVVLMGNRMAVLEFKCYDTILQAHVDQTAAYARDLANYHAASHGVSVLPCLVLTRWHGEPTTVDDVTVVARDRVAEVLHQFAGQARGGPAVQAEAWLTADYAPLPSLVAAARSILEHEPLPAIRRAASALHWS